MAWAAALVRGLVGALEPALAGVRVLGLVEAREWVAVAGAQALVEAWAPELVEVRALERVGVQERVVYTALIQLDAERRNILLILITPLIVG